MCRIVHKYAQKYAVRALVKITLRALVWTYIFSSKYSNFFYFLLACNKLWLEIHLKLHTFYSSKIETLFLPYPNKSVEINRPKLHLLTNKLVYVFYIRFGDL